MQTKTFKLERPVKAYKLNQCALYKIKGRGQLLKVLNWTKSFEALEELISRDDNYRVFLHKKTQRMIQHPKPRMDKLQSRIATLLRRVAPPEYRHSGVPGRSFLSNAQEHPVGPSVKADIEKFYPSTTFVHIYDFFKSKMLCADDIAHILAQICSYQNAHLPTGARHSEVLAFFCHKEIFDEMRERAISRNGVMTSYIDDVMMTMDSASNGDLSWVKRLFSRAGLKLNLRKSRICRADQARLITGVISKKGRKRAPHKQHLKVLREFISLDSYDEKSPEYASHARKLIGHLNHIAMLDMRFIKRAIGNRMRLKKKIA